MLLIFHIPPGYFMFYVLGCFMCFDFSTDDIFNVLSGRIVQFLLDKGGVQML